MRIAFLGTGRMGEHQARRLLDAGHRLTVWNRTPQKARALEREGATLAATPAEAVAGAAAVFTMLEDGAIVERVLFDSGALGQLAQGAVVIDTSSIEPAQAIDHARRLEARGVQHLDAPVSGGVTGAEAGTLAIMVGGRPEVFETMAPVLSSMGRAIWVGPHGAGQMTKLANQVMVAIHIAAVSEALQLAGRGGADPARVREAIRGGFAESRVLELHGEKMIKRDFETQARATMQLKDLRNALRIADRLGFVAPTTRTVASLFEGLVERVGETDHSALWTQIEAINADPAAAAREVTSAERVVQSPQIPRTSE